MKQILILGLWISFSVNLWSQTCTMNIPRQKVCLGTAVSFSVSVSGGGTITGYSWDFGNSATSNQSSPVYQYTATGIYTPSVTVTFWAGTHVKLCRIFVPHHI